MKLIGLFKNFPDVPVFIGGCVSRGRGSSFRARAHAHTTRARDSRGWICVRSPKRIFKPDGKTPSNLMLHELAHILTDQGHTDKFRAKLRELGGRATLNARKRKLK